MKYWLLFFLAINAGETGFAQGAYTEAEFFVDDSLPAKIPAEVFQLQQRKDNKLHIYIPDSAYFRHYGDKKVYDVMRAYLINNNDDSLLVSECDGLVFPAMIQHYRYEQWITSIVGHPPSCWNDCTKVFIRPNSFLILNIFLDHLDRSHTTRVRLKLKNGDYFSNEIKGCSPRPGSDL